MPTFKALLLLAAATCAFSANAQFHYRGSARVADDEPAVISPLTAEDSIDPDALPPDTVVSLTPLPAYFFMPSVYTHYDFPDSTDIAGTDFSGEPALR